ncbi:MAG: ATP-binding cassette domain-containing protein, partial [bacterium]|nr:ATP-binding cassette domain-containing protein [bacterium]
SGSGKTTITRLIARFWDVDAGAVRVSGVDVRDFTAEALMTQLAMVFQDTYLFGGSIADNLRLARPDATDSDLARAAELARLDEVIERLPGGWETDVGEGGFSLSGGERQRVAIARALLKPAPIVLLDEATAALDPENEAAVQNAIDSLRQDRTVIVIAHRLSTVATADQIVVLANGGVAEVGSHQELLALGGRYASFWHETSRAAGWRLAPQD